MEQINNIWYCIVNPRAGSGKTMSEWIPAERKLEKLKVPFITEYTDYKKHATAIAYEAAKEGYRKFAAVGGDGSLHEVFCGICRYCENSGTSTSEFKLAVVPIGSGNDWVKSLGVSSDAKDIVGLIAADSFRPMDVVAVDLGGNRTYMANVGGTGFDAHVCKRVNAKKERGMRGKGIYFSSLLRSIFSTRAMQLKVTADGRTAFEGPCYSIALGNGPYSGSGMRQVPKADLSDNMLDVMIVPKISLWSIIRELPRLFNGSLDQCDKVKYLRCSSLKIEALNSRSADIVEIDGEIEGSLPLSIEMQDRTIYALSAKARRQWRRS